MFRLHDHLQAKIYTAEINMTDNRSNAAAKLNKIVKTFEIELRRRKPLTLILYEVLIFHMRAKCDTRVIFIHWIPLIFYIKNNSANYEAPHYATFTIHQLLPLMTKYPPQHLVLECP
jgi:hypothetical protein